MSRDNWVKSLGLDTDGSLFVEIENGIRLYDLCLNSRLPEPITIHPQDLMQPKNRHLYQCFLKTLKEIEGVIIHCTYDSDYAIQSGDIVVDAGQVLAVQISIVVALAHERSRLPNSKMQNEAGNYSYWTTS